MTPFLQTSVRGGRPQLAPPYAELFEAGWQNTLVVVQAALFTVLFWALLFLWAELFDVVGVGVFESLFQEPAFVYPVTSVTFGYAVALAQSREQFVLLLRRHLFGVLLWLLPLVAFIASAFLVTLPATGLAPLWKTGHATFLMLWLQVFLLFFFNAAYQDGANPPPYPPWLRVALRAACVAVPVYASLCVYSLSLRIAQHGLSVDRIWALLFTAVIGLYGAGYAYAALRDGPWMARLGRVNTAMAGVLAALIVAVTTPLLEPKRLAAADQVVASPRGQGARREVRLRLLAIQPRRVRRSGTSPACRGAGRATPSARRSRAGPRRRSPSRAAGSSRARRPISPPPSKCCPRARRWIRSWSPSSAGRRTARRASGLVCLRVSGLACVVLVVDLDGDGVEEVASVNGFPMNVYARTAAGWRRVGELREEMGQMYGSPFWLDSIRSMPARATPSRWHVLEAGGRRLYLAESVPH